MFMGMNLVTHIMYAPVTKLCRSPQNREIRNSFLPQMFPTIRMLPDQSYKMANHGGQIKSALCSVDLQCTWVVSYLSVSYQVLPMTYTLSLLAIAFTYIDHKYTL